MRTSIGIALGFAIIPATLALVAVFAWASSYFKVAKSDLGIGFIFGMVIILIGFAILIKKIN